MYSLFPGMCNYHMFNIPHQRKGNISNLVRRSYLFLAASFSSMHDTVVSRKSGSLGMLSFATNFQHCQAHALFFANTSDGCASHSQEFKHHMSSLMLFPSLFPSPHQDISRKLKLFLPEPTPCDVLLPNYLKCLLSHPISMSLFQHLDLISS